MKKLAIVPLFLSIFSNLFSQNVNTHKNIKVQHSKEIKLRTLISSGKVDLDTKTDTPYSNEFNFSEPWARYYDYKEKKFLSKNNGGNRVLPLKINFNINGSKIISDDYSQYIIKSSSTEKTDLFNILTYSCIDETGNICDFSILTNNSQDTYILVEYGSVSYIYSSKN